MEIIHFNGRKDGIGNRVEQLIFLNNFCKKYNKICHYYWNNSNTRKDRKYEIKIKFKYIIIQEKEKYPKQYKHPELYTMRRGLEPTDFHFTFAIPDLEHEFFAIHIRSTDRITKKTQSDFIDKNTFKKCLDKSIKLANKSRGKNVYICGDSKNYINYVKNRIKNKNILVKKKDGNIPKEWIDYYYLTKAYKIIMCSRFSSFSTTASILGNSPIVSFFNKNETTLKRFKANVKVVGLN